MTDAKIPKWIRQEEDCLYCHTFSGVHKIEERGNDIAVIYLCNNDKCSYLRLGYGKHKYTAIYSGFAKQYENYLAVPQDTQTNVDVTAQDITT